MAEQKKDYRYEQVEQAADRLIEAGFLPSWYREELVRRLDSMLEDAVETLARAVTLAVLDGARRPGTT